MVGLIAIITSIIAAASEEKNVCKSFEYKYSKKDLLFLSAMYEDYYFLIEPTEIQELQAVLGNGLVCPDGHDGPFKFTQIDYSTRDMKNDNGLTVFGEEERMRVQCPCIASCKHKEHTNESTRDFVLDPFLQHMEIDYEDY